jgi:protein-disulfide isomerase
VKTRTLALLSTLLVACSGGPSTKDKKPKGVEPKPDPKTPSAAAATPAEPDRPKRPAISSLPGFDLAVLPDESRDAFLEAVTSETSPCDRPETVAACVAKNPGCMECPYLARAAYRLARDGEPRAEELAQLMDAIKEALAAPKKTFDLKGVPMRGDPNAKVAVVEFADFQCPHCAELAKQLKGVFPVSDKKVAFYFKNFPLPTHDKAELAARAALAAGRQGKFWEYESLLFERQLEISEEKIKAWATELGLDAAKFATDLASKELADQVARDREEAKKAELAGTPVLFIDGTLYKDLLTPEAILDAIDLAIAKKAQGGPTPTDSKQ